MGINFNDLHDKMSQVTSGSISREYFSEWLDENIDIDVYIPVATKYAIASVFSKEIFSGMSGMDIAEDIDYIFLKYETERLFNSLFPYIKIKISKSNKTFENYDLIFKSGLYDYVMKFCESDYKRFLDIFDRVSGINTLTIMNQFVTFIGKQPNVEDMERIRDIINDEIDTNKMEILKAVQEYNSPVMKQVIQGLSTESLKEVIKDKKA